LSAVIVRTKELPSKSLEPGSPSKSNTLNLGLDYPVLHMTEVSSTYELREDQDASVALPDCETLIRPPSPDYQTSETEAHSLYS